MDCIKALSMRACMIFMTHPHGNLHSQEPNTSDPYLSILVDELLSITNKEVFDAYQDAPFKMKVDILMYILDYQQWKQKQGYILI